MSNKDKKYDINNILSELEDFHHFLENKNELLTPEDYDNILSKFDSNLFSDDISLKLKYSQFKHMFYRTCSYNSMKEQLGLNALQMAALLELLGVERQKYLNCKE